MSMYFVFCKYLLYFVGIKRQPRNKCEGKYGISENINNKVVKKSISPLNKFQFIFALGA